MKNTPDSEHSPQLMGLDEAGFCKDTAFEKAYLIAAVRMRPDRIILGELRGVEAFTFLRAVNTGHPGSMTTIHADTPQRAIEQFSLLVLQGWVKALAR